jgi:hypothetical protein
MIYQTGPYSGVILYLYSGTFRAAALLASVDDMLDVSAGTQKAPCIP